MVWNPFRIIPKKFLGIDIGTSFIKIVELSSAGERRKLENYGEASASILYQKPFRTFERNTLSLSSKEIAGGILAILNEANIQSRNCMKMLQQVSAFVTLLLQVMLW